MQTLGYASIEKNYCETRNTLFLVSHIASDESHTWLTMVDQRWLESTIFLVKEFKIE